MGFNIYATLFPPQPEKLQLAEPEQEDFDSNKYLALAKSVRFDGAERAVKEEVLARKSGALRQFLSENGITVYAERKVSRYMGSITPVNHRWVWRPVSNAQRNPQGVDPYAKPIPEAVLMTMAKILAAFPHADFEVTDIVRLERHDIDPFLRVTIDRNNWFIIERWDEPKFRS